MNFPTKTHNNFVEKIKLAHRKDEQLVHEIAELLNLSTDSAYRRLRGSTLFNIEEVAILCDHYNISFDSLLSDHNSNKVTFNYRYLDNKGGLKGFLKVILAELKTLHDGKNPHLTFMSNDFSLFHLLQVPELFQFKSFFWLKTYSPNNEMENEDFEIKKWDEELNFLRLEILHYYNSIPSTDIINDEILNGTIKQIKYFHSSGVIRSDVEKDLIANKLQALIIHLKEQATKGRKFIYGTSDWGNEYLLYKNDISLIDHVILTETTDFKKVFLPQNCMNYISSENKSFSQNINSYIHNVMAKSTLISKYAEKDRELYFKGLMKKIAYSFDSEIVAS